MIYNNTMTEGIKIISKEEYDEKNGRPNQEDVWDNISWSWSKFRQAKIPIIVEFLKGKKGKVIDLGCGAGRNMIPSKDIKYYGFDISSCQLGKAITYAEENNINAEFFKMSAHKLSKKDFKKDMFDYGLFIATLHCIENSDNRLRALKELYRVLKPRAEALISVWNSQDTRFDNVRKEKDIYMSWKYEGNIYYRYYYLYSKEELINLITKAGFKILEFYEHDENNDRFSKKNWIVRVGK